MPRPNFALPESASSSASISQPRVNVADSNPASSAASANTRTSTASMEEYSDASSSYWPPGWDFSRFCHATDADRAALPAGELEKMQAGLRDVLGEEGVAVLARRLFREEQNSHVHASHAKTGTETEGHVEGGEEKRKGKTEMAPPNWLRRWRKRSARQQSVEGGKNWPWGFVVFCVGNMKYGDGEVAARWETYKTQVEKLVRLSFQHDENSSLAIPEDYHDATAGFELRWVEEESLVGADATMLRRRYAEMRDGLPSGLTQDIFLCASNEAVASVVDSQADVHSTPGDTRFSPDAPFLLAVAADGDPVWKRDMKRSTGLNPCSELLSRQWQMSYGG